MNKYFEEGNLIAYTFASIFDPLHKLVAIKKLLMEESESIKEKIVSLYDSHYKYLEVTESAPSSDTSAFTKVSLVDEYEALLGISFIHRDERSDLDLYISEDVKPFSDVIAYWKCCAGRFPALSKMAADF